jgi:copper resistance protein D
MTTLLILARAGYFGSGMIVVSAVMFRWLILRPNLAEGYRMDFRFLIKSAALLLLFSVLALFWITTAMMGDVSLLEALSEFPTVLFQTGFGTVCLVRAGFALLLIGGLCFFRETILAFAAAGLLLSNAWIGHIAAAPGSFVAARIAVDAIHLLSASVWPTGLLFFGLFLRWARDGALRRDDIVSVARGFSRVSLLAVLLLSITGVVNACAVLADFSALTDTVYGRLLCLKLVLFFAMLNIAAWNRFQILPALAATEDSLLGESFLLRLRNFVLIEFYLGAAIVIVVAILGVIPP